MENHSAIACCSRLIALCALVSLPLSACNKPSPPQQAVATGPAVPPPPAFTADEFQKLVGRVDKLEIDARVQGLITESETTAYMKPTVQEFQSVRTSIGYLTVNIVNVADYANGSQVILQIGNPTAAVLSGPKATIEWGRVDANGVPTGQVYSRDQEFTEATPAGSWKRYTVNLEGVPSKELGYVRVKNVDTKSISLHQTY
jgi:Protein of unknown function (DUF3251)